MSAWLHPLRGYQYIRSVLVQRMALVVRVRWTNVTLGGQQEQDKVPHGFYMWDHKGAHSTMYGWNEVEATSARIPTVFTSSAVETSKKW